MLAWIVARWGALLASLRPDHDAFTEAWRARRDKLISEIPETQRQKPTYEPYGQLESDPRIRLYFEGRGPDGRFMRERIDWQGYEFRHMPLKSRADWRDWHIAQELAAFQRLLGRLKKAERQAKVSRNTRSSSR
jgi:hypothetical protein